MTKRFSSVVGLSLMGLWAPSQAHDCNPPDEPDGGCHGQHCEKDASADASEDASDASQDAGCEANTQTDPNNCGACGYECRIANGYPACVAGHCEILACTEGYANCNGNASDGCETDLEQPSSCGACGNQCPYTQSCCTASCCLTEPTCGEGCDPYCTLDNTWSVSGQIAVNYAGDRRLWQRATNTPMSYLDAKAYCESLVLEGIGGWRLPSPSELGTLRVHCGGLQGCRPGYCCPCFDQAAFIGTEHGVYWTNRAAVLGGELQASVMDTDNGRIYQLAPGTDLDYSKCTHDPL